MPHVGASTLAPCLDLDRAGNAATSCSKAGKALMLCTSVFHVARMPQPAVGVLDQHVQHHSMLPRKVVQGNVS